MNQGFKITGYMVTLPLEEFVQVIGNRPKELLQGRERKIASPGLLKLKAGGTSWIMVTSTVSSTLSACNLNLGEKTLVTRLIQ